jgi:hypothetical protein
MGKYLSVIIGAVVTLLGVIALVGWQDDFFALLRGSIPAVFIFGGVIAMIAGISEMKDELESKKKE